MRLIIHTDGGARGNPGPAGIGVVIHDADSGALLEEHAEFLGVTTNNQAEYSAVILALKRAKALDATEVQIITDSELVVKQANGEYRVKHPGLAQRFSEMKQLASTIHHCRFQHVRRAFNQRADALSNQAMDRGMHLR
jgi:ribonuclease HI